MMDDASFDFQRWMLEAHPDITLTAQQLHWVRSQEQGKDTMWLGGIQSGKSFILRLYREYIAQTKPIEMVEHVWIMTPFGTTDD